MIDRDLAEQPTLIAWSDGLSAGTETVDSFLQEVARLSSTTPGKRLPALRSDFVVARRYRLTRPVGRGAHGVVWAAEDTLTREEVAVKVLLTSTRQQAARVCAEVASLRCLRLRGVVRLLDDGMEAGSLFLVMPVVDGAPFPGPSVRYRERTTWDDISAATNFLLETIAEVHAVGIVHRDLKPANVLVDAQGRATILDFGLALAPTFTGLFEEGRVAGTPSYLAPEQAAGGAVEPAADLYAIGVMIYRALTGRLPHEAADLHGLLQAKRTAPAPLRSLCPETPEHVADTVDRLLATEPGDRPSSALVALELLRGTPSVPRPPPSGSSVALLEASEAPYPVESLLALFSGRDRLAWTREDAARLLFHRTGGDPARVSREVDAWVRAGWCRRTGPDGGLIVAEDCVDRLEMGFDLQPAPEPLALAEKAISLAEDLARRGRLGNATAALHEALAALRRTEGVVPPCIQSGPLAERALSLWVEVALSVATPRALDHVLYEICRLSSPSLLVTRLESLVRAALAVGAWTERALELASTLPPFDEPALERLRQGVRVMAARRVSLEREEALMDELSPLATLSSPSETRAALAGWLGRLRYRQGRFEEAADLHHDAAEGSSWTTRRASSLVSQASALMEAFDFDKAADVAGLALELARETRHVYGRAQAEWMVRIIAYRRGVAIASDLEWVEAIAALRIPELEALVCLTESATAWRRSDLDLALTLANRAKRAWSSVGERGGGLLLVSALAIACAPKAAAQDDIESLAAQALDFDVPGVGIQVLGLMAPARRLMGARARELDAKRLNALALQVPERHWGLRIDVLSVAEALARISPQEQSATIV